MAISEVESAQYIPWSRSFETSRELLQPDFHHGRVHITDRTPPDNSRSAREQAKILHTVYEHKNTNREWTSYILMGLRGQSFVSRSG